MISGTVTLYWHASDLEELRRAASARALKDGLGDEEAATYLTASARECALMLLDPGTSPDGLEIDESEASDDTEETHPDDEDAEETHQ